jgi:hypothetical protein
MNRLTRNQSRALFVITCMVALVWVMTGPV